MAMPTVPFRHLLSLIATLVGPLVFGAVRLGHAGNLTDRVASAENLYNEARFGEAAELLEQHLKADGASKRSEAVLLLGSCYVALGKDGAARRVFVDGLDADASLALPQRSSPKVRDVFSKARAEFLALPARLEWASPLAIASPVGAGTRIRIRTRHVVGKPYELTLHARLNGEAAYQAVRFDVRPDGSATADWQVGTPTSPETLAASLYVEAREGTALRLSLGSAEAPVNANLPFTRPTVQPTGQPIQPVTPAGSAAMKQPDTTPVIASAGAGSDTPVYKKAWFWGVIGGAAVLVAGGIVLGAVVAHNSSRPPSGDLRVGFEVAP